MVWLAVIVIEHKTRIKLFAFEGHDNLPDLLSFLEVWYSTYSSPGFGSVIKVTSFPGLAVVEAIKIANNLKQFKNINLFYSFP